MTSSRLLKTAHLRRWPAWALIAAYLEYASLGPGYPSVGWVTPPCIWAFLSSCPWAVAHPAGVKMVLPECGISDSAAIFEAAWTEKSFSATC